MEWYWIVLITIAVYNIIGFILMKITDENDDVAIYYAVGCVYPFFLVAKFFYRLIKFGRKKKGINLCENEDDE